VGEKAIQQTKQKNKKTKKQKNKKTKKGKRIKFHNFRKQPK
jgi:hypothetical protein